MRLYLMRHGIAEDAGIGQADRDRALTAQGRARLAAQAEAMRVLGWPVDRLVSSPLVRAWQTAEAIAPALGVAPEVDARLGLGASPEAYLAVAADAGGAHIFLVGHQPDLETALYTFTGAAAKVRKGTLAVVEMSRLRPGGGRLRALFDPDEMAALGSARTL